MVALAQIVLDAPLAPWSCTDCTVSLETVHPCNHAPGPPVARASMCPRPSRNMALVLRWGEPTRYQGWRDRVRMATRSREDLLMRQALYSLRGVPGFAPIRQQAPKIEALMRGEHTRTHRGPFSFSHTRIRYIQRLPVLSKPLSAVLAGIHEARHATSSPNVQLLNL
jgi:hypothetical protein